MRPISIRWFDRLFLTALALSLPLGALETWQVLATNPGTTAYALLSFGVPIILWLCLWFFISVRASKIAKWIWTLFLVADLVSFPIVSAMAGGYFTRALFLHGVLGIAVHIARLLLLITATGMLFRHDANQWFASRGRPIDASIFS
ncbi:hypothetical protein [Novosphingobium sp. SG720]|uniref:hypothetical protein n=1 Tax=Novosphingobium sp. SG720 TaxID=2586998 RepID=UPI00144591B1|nr:hypothetical protein [Novosphingobium sp. SG720]NKJ42406.1 putative membrane protein [Novosphingobium sp. SG720]